VSPKDVHEALKNVREAERVNLVDGESATAFEGSDRRVKFLLYRNEVPAQPTADNAYRDLHLWVEVRTGR